MLFAADGADLVLVARREGRLGALAAELTGRYGSRVLAVSRDLSAPAACGEIERELRKKGVSVDVLVNNAGFGDLGSFAELPLERQLSMVQVNVMALTDLTRRLLPAMIERKKGGILNVASTAGFQPGPWMSVYYATKSYVLNLTEGLAEELGGTGVTATCLCPGPTATEFETEAHMESSRLFRLGAMSAAKVARIGYAALRRGKVVTVTGLRYKLLAQSVRLAPRALVRKVAKFLNGGPGSR